MKIKKIIDLAVAKLYEQSVGVTQQEIGRVVKKAILLSIEKVKKGEITIEEIVEELTDE